MSNIIDLCKYCGVDLPPTKNHKKRIVLTCKKHKRKHYLDTYPKYKEIDRKWNQENQEKVRENRIIWVKNNPEKMKLKRERQNRSIVGRFYNGKSKAKKFNQDWELTKEQYEKIVDSKCVYCGDNLSYCGTGLDRKDCSKGYTLDNVVPCCGPCNKVKFDILTYNQMKVGMSEISEYKKYGHLGLFS